MERKLRWQQGQKTLQEVRDTVLGSDVDVETKIKANALLRFSEVFAQQQLTAIYKSEVDSKYYIFDAQKFGIISGEAFRYFLPATANENPKFQTMFVRGIEFQSWMNQRFDIVSIPVDTHTPSQPLQLDERDAASIESQPAIPHPLPMA